MTEYEFACFVHDEHLKTNDLDRLIEVANQHTDCAPEDLESTMPHEITDAQIDAAYKVADEFMPRPFGPARVADYFPDAEPPSPGPERDAAFAALRAADEDCDRRNREVMRAILAAALNAR